MINTDDCWLYAGYKNTLGYGQIFFRVEGKSKYQYAHRAMYEALVAPIPEGLVIDHLCRVRHCINPKHLEVVTTRENTLRGDGVLINKLKTHCPRGHEYTEENTQMSSSNWRRCRTCTLKRHREFRLSHLEYTRNYMRQWRARNR